MIDSYDFNSVAGSLSLDARIAPVFRGALSGNLQVGFSNHVEGQSLLLFLNPNGFAISFGGVSFPSGTTFPTGSDSVVRVTRIAGSLYGEVISP